MALSVEQKVEPPILRPIVLIPLVAFLLAIAYLGVLVFKPFFLDLLVAGSVALFLTPLQRRLARGTGPNVAAALLVAASAIVILVPILSFVLLLGNEAGSFFDWLLPNLQPAALQRLWRETLPTRYPWLREWFRLGEDALMPVVAGALSRVATLANGLIQGAVTGLTSALFELFLFLMMLFFLLRDGGKLRRELQEISPLSDEQEELVFDHLSKTVKAVLQAMAVVPIVQGVLALVGFWLFGVPSALLWSVMVVIAALVPIVGSPLAWVPAGIYMIAIGATWPGVGVLIYGLVIISAVDNVVKPILLRGGAQIHPLLGFLSVLGGLFAFGAVGFLVGPVIVSLMLSAVRIYKLDILRAHDVPVAPS